ncbi:MAG: hypothetical protein NWF01_07455 [Candidatus Bathyarchaeota archaeon]|nr:hypothetical protein [Candidatus Bathyarchaeota archaeon]
MRLQRANKIWKVLFCILLLAVLCISEAPHTLADDTLEENSWSVLPEDEKKGFLQCAAVDGKVYAFCFNMTTHAITVHIYDPQTETWSTKTSTFDTPLGGEIILHTAAVAVDDNIFFWGYGICRDGILNNKAYSISTNQWSSISPSPNLREDPSACVVNGKIYVIGGVIDQGVPSGEQFRQTAPTGLLEIYDPQTGTWVTKKSMDEPVSYHGSVAVDDRIYVFGGGYIQIYNTKTDQWKTLTAPQANEGFQDAKATSDKYTSEKIYLFGVSALQIFDPQTETFTDNVSFPEHKSAQYPNVTFGNFLQSFKVAVVDDVFYLIGGAASGTLYKQWTTPEGRVIKSSGPVSVNVDYRYVPLGYSASSSSDGDVNSWLFYVAGVVVAVAVLAGAAVVVFRFRRSSSKQPSSQLTSTFLLATY